MTAELVPIERFEVAWPGGAARTAASLTEIWLRSFKSQHTQACYRRDLMGWLAWCQACNTNPSTARIAHMDMWIARQREDGAAETTIARRVSAVSSWYRYLIDNTAQDAVPLATANPAKTRAKPKIDPDSTPTVALSAKEADALIDAADGHSLTAAALIRLLLITGVRVGSAIDADISDLGRDGEHRILVITVKGSGRKKVAIPPVLGTAINAMLADRGDPADGPLFVTRRGRRIHQVWVWRLVRRLCATSPHGLRHTAITELFEAGVPVQEVQQFAHHRSVRTTLRYLHGKDNLDKHGAYVLATRYGSRRES